MSDPMMGGRPPMPPSGGMPMGGSPGGMPGGGMAGKMSMLNPTDVAAKGAMGQISKGMTVGQFLQQNFGVSPNDPIEKFIQVMKQQSQNATMPGKLGISPQGPAPRPPMGGMGSPPGAPMGGPPMGGSSGPPNLEGLMSKL